MGNAISIDTSDVNEVGLQKVNSNILLIAKRQILKSPDYVLYKKPAQSQLPSNPKESCGKKPKLVEPHPSYGTRQQQLTELASTWPFLPQQDLQRYIKT